MIDVERSCIKRHITCSWWWCWNWIFLSGSGVGGVTVPHHYFHYHLVLLIVLKKSQYFLLHYYLYVVVSVVCCVLDSVAELELAGACASVVEEEATGASAFTSALA